MIYMTAVEANTKVLAILTMLQRDWGVDRWLRRFTAEEQEEMIEQMVLILQAEDAP